MTPPVSTPSPARDASTQTPFHMPVGCEAVVKEGIFQTPPGGGSSERRCGSFRMLRHDGGDFRVDAEDEIGVSLVLNAPRIRRRLNGRQHEDAPAGVVAVMVPGCPVSVTVLDPAVAVQARLPIEFLRRVWAEDHGRDLRFEDVPPSLGTRNDALAGLLCQAVCAPSAAVDEIEREVAARLLDLATDRAPSAGSDELKRGGLQSWKLRRLSELVEDRLLGGVALAEAASEVGMSPFHFARSFRAETGRTFLSFVTERRLARALPRIGDTDEPLDCVARACGFAHASHLNRHLNDRFGMPAAAIRRSCRL